MTLSTRTIVVALLAAFLLAAASSPAAARPRLGLYDCAGPGGGLKHSVKLKGRGRYVYATTRKGRKLRGPVPGRWRMRGRRKMVFRSGIYRNAGFSGVWNRPRRGFFILLDRRGEPTGIECRPVRR